MFQKEPETPEEKAARLGVPLIPKLKFPRADSNPTISVCGECGIEIKKAMMFACGNPNCPVLR